MTTKHTPGPWILDPLLVNTTDNEKEDEKMTFKSGYLRDADGAPFCNFLATDKGGWLADFDALEAYARLCQAAPKLLKALEHIIEEPEQWLNAAMWYNNPEDRPMTKRREVIAERWQELVDLVNKATGEKEGSKP